VVVEGVSAPDRQLICKSIKQPPSLSISITDVVLEGLFPRDGNRNSCPFPGTSNDQADQQGRQEEQSDQQRPVCVAFALTGNFGRRWGPVTRRGFCRLRRFGSGWSLGRSWDSVDSTGTSTASHAAKERANRTVTNSQLGRCVFMGYSFRGESEGDENLLDPTQIDVIG